MKVVAIACNAFDVDSTRSMKGNGRHAATCKERFTLEFLPLKNRCFNKTMIILRAIESDFAAMWPIFQEISAAGETYVFSAETSYEEAFAYWLAPGVTCNVAEDGGRIVGMYRLVPNQPDRGAHVANASFMLDPSFSGRGIGNEMGLHCLREAWKAGYLAMQFNAVVSTNAAAVALWKKLGFRIVGTVPRAFMHARLGHVDTYIMHRFLNDIRV
jgi:RimJ/RimL family protein N-acetyltransferase